MLPKLRLLTLTLAAILCLSGSDPLVAEPFFDIHEEEEAAERGQPIRLVQSGTTTKCETDLDCPTSMVCGERRRCEVPKGDADRGGHQG